MPKSSSGLHLWLLTLKDPFSKIILSEDEQARASKIRHLEAQTNFGKTRTALRVLLAAYQNCAPEEIVFDYNPSGKPFIKESPYAFNLSHSHGFAVIGIAPVKKLGIDIEFIQPYPSMERVVQRFFSEAEIAQFSELAPHLKDRFFYELWTQKEAFTKAEGISIFQGMKDLSIPQDSNKPVHFCGPLPLPQNYAGSYASSTLIHSIKQFQFNGQEIASLAVGSFDPL